MPNRRIPLIGLAVTALLGAGVLVVAMTSRWTAPGQPTPTASTASMASTALRPAPTHIPGAPTDVPGRTGAPAAVLVLPAVANGAPAGIPIACAGVGLATVLRGDPADPHVAWLVPFAGSGREDVLWPQGYHARFAPDLEVLDATGAVVAREGDFIDGGCVVGQAGELEIVPEQPTFALECGPMPVETCTGGNPVYQIRQELGARFPGRGTTTVQFVTRDGAYRVLFRDGGTFEGRITGFE